VWYRPVMLRAPGALVLFATTVCVLLPTEAAAQDDMQRAKELFEQGVSGMNAGEFETACPALTEAYELSKRPGPLFTSAECYAKWGKVATAQSRYRSYLSVYVALDPEGKEAEEDRQTVAKEQIGALDGMVPTLTLVLAPSAPEGTVVTRDGESVPSSSLGKAQALDPGSYTVTIETPSGEIREQTVVLRVAENKKLVLELSASSGGDGDDTPVEPAPADGEAMRTGAFVAGGIGIVGVTLGIVTGVVALAKKGDISDNCEGEICNQDGKDAADSAQLFGTLSTVGFIVGGVGLATGAVLFVLAPDEKPSDEVGWRVGAGGAFGDASGASLTLSRAW